jgi:hypothetical protein
VTAGRATGDGGTAAADVAIDVVVSSLERLALTAPACRKGDTLAEAAMSESVRPRTSASACWDAGLASAPLSLTGVGVADTLCRGVSSARAVGSGMVVRTGRTDAVTTSRTCGEADGAEATDVGGTATPDTTRDDSGIAPVTCGGVARPWRSTRWSAALASAALSVTGVGVPVAPCRGVSGASAVSAGMVGRAGPTDAVTTSRACGETAEAEATDTGGTVTRGTSGDDSGNAPVIRADAAAVSRPGVLA